MDTTAAAELGMGEPVGTAFWDTGPPGPDQWGDHGDDDSLDNVDISWDRPKLHAGAASLHEFQQASHSSFGGKRTPSLEPPQKTSRTMPDESPQHSNEGPSHHSFSGGCSGHGGGSPLGRSNPSSSTAGVGSPNFGTVGSSPLCAGVVGRGRGMGSIFYKTKLCSRFRSGNCPYNTNCNFAHGMEELRKPPPGWEEFVASQEFPPPPSQAGGQGGSGAAAGSTDSQVRFHKTRPCKKYFGEGNCPYGEKCNFLHDEQSVPRVIREAREAVVAASGAVVAVSPKVETLILTTHGNVKETGGLGVSTPAGSATSNWKTRFCNKWETTGHCPFRDKCYLSHGSDELQKYGGELPDTIAPALSDPKSGGTPSRDLIAVSSHQRHHGGTSSARSVPKGNTNWRGPNEVSIIHGDWWVEDDNWQCGGTTTSHESTEHEGDACREAQRRTPLLALSSSTPKTVSFFRCTNSLEPSRQNLSRINGCASISQQDGEAHKRTFQCEGVNAMGKEDIHGSVLQPEHGWRSELR